MRKIKLAIAFGAVFALMALVGGGIYFQRQALPPRGDKPAPTQPPLPTAAPTTLKVYFGNSQLNQNQDCSRVYPVEREIPQTQAVAKAALNELFAGPTAEERAQGYSSLFSEKTKSILKSVKVEDETAYVDLVDIRPVLGSASTSCGSAAFLAEVESTLKQFSTVKKVVLAIEGKPETFYEWLQIGCSPQDSYCDPTPFR